MSRHAFAAIVVFLVPSAFAADPAFDEVVKPVLLQYCSACHDDHLASGGLIVSVFAEDASTLESRRDGWERILSKIRSGQMPPRSAPHPPAEKTEALIRFVEGQFARVDKSAKADPTPH